MVEVSIRALIPDLDRVIVDVDPELRCVIIDRCGRILKLEDVRCYVRWLINLAQRDRTSRPLSIHRQHLLPALRSRGTVGCRPLTRHPLFVRVIRVSVVSRYLTPLPLLTRTSTPQLLHKPLVHHHHLGHHP